MEPLEKAREPRDEILDRLVPFAAIAALIVMAALFVFFAVWAVLLLT